MDIRFWELDITKLGEREKVANQNGAVIHNLYEKFDSFWKQFNGRYAWREGERRGLL